MEEQFSKRLNLKEEREVLIMTPLVTYTLLVSGGNKRLLAVGRGIRERLTVTNSVYGDGMRSARTAIGQQGRQAPAVIQWDFIRHIWHSELVFSDLLKCGLHWL